MWGLVQGSKYHGALGCKVYPQGQTRLKMALQEASEILLQWKKTSCTFGRSQEHCALARPRATENLKEHDSSEQLVG